MAHLGGGAEAHARFKQYEYRANSSLVLTTDSRPRDTHEPTGEPESLWGKIDPKSFGDRAFRGKPLELEEKIKKSKKKKEREPALEPEQKKDSKRRRIQEESVLSLTDDAVYQPKTKETRAAYEALLSVIQQQFGGQPQDILSGAADEVLVVLKNEKIKNPDKKKEIEKLLNPISNQVFDQLVSIGRLITDYQDAGVAADSAAANGNGEALDDIGVAVEFEEDEEEEESDYDQVHKTPPGFIINLSVEIVFFAIHIILVQYMGRYKRNRRMMTMARNQMLLVLCRWVELMMRTWKKLMRVKPLTSKTLMLTGFKGRYLRLMRRLIHNKARNLQKRC